MHSLRIKTMVITIAAILASMVAFGLASFFTVGREATTSSAEKMHLLSESAEMTLDTYLHGVEQSVAMTSRYAMGVLDAVELVENDANTPTSIRSAERTEHLDAYLSSHCAQVQEVLGNVAGSTGGIVSYYYCINPDVSGTEHGFFYSKMGKVGFEVQEPIDASRLSSEDVEHDGWYYKPIGYGRATWVGPYPDRYLQDVPTVSYVTPIYKSGILIGVLGMDILFDTLVDQIDDLSIYRTGFACLLDADGHILYHPGLAQGERPHYIERLVEDGGLHRDSCGNEVIRYEKEGVQWQLSFSTLSNGMKLVVTAPVSEVIASWMRLMQSVPVIAALILALFIPLTLMAMRAVTNPLHQITVAAHALAAGDYNVNLDYEGKDEVGELTDAFRRMSNHLRVYISNLDSRSYVDDLTGVKNQAAYGIFAARVDDEIAEPESSTQLSLGVVVIHCIELQAINEAYGHVRGDEHLKTTCRLINQIFALSNVFRMGGDDFVVVLQGRDYANRKELLVDFEIMAEEASRTASDPWLRIYVAKGLAKFRPGEDQNLEMIVHRAEQRMQEDKATKGV